MSFTSKTRIAILADFPLTALESGAIGRGGGQQSTWLPQLALAFSHQNDLDIQWVILDRGIRKPIQHSALGQQFHRVPACKFSLDLALNYLPTRRALRAALRCIQADIVHAWGTECIYPAVLRDFQGPRILSMQGILTEYRRIGGLPEDWRWNRMVASEPAFISSATVVTSESQWGIDLVRQIAPVADCRMVEYGVHPDFYQLPWNPDPEVPYALYVGGKGIRKGLDVLIEALRLMPERRWTLRLAGDPGMADACRDAGLPLIECLGLLSWPEMQKQLQGAWCSVLPTRADTSPNSVKEARVVGLPVVTTRHGGQAGYIIDDQNGRIVDPLSPRTLAEALRDVMQSHERAVAMGQCRHEEDRAYLHPQRTADAFISLYRELASRMAVQTT
jgi:glycosyltransferase involved in cell wall biosynthesis